MTQQIESDQDHKETSKVLPSTGAIPAEGRTISTSFKSLAELSENATKTAAVFLAVMYVIGLLTVNMYLVTLHVSDFSLLKPRYVLTGAVVLLSYFFVVVPAFGASTLDLIAKNFSQYTLRQKRQSVVSTVVALLFPALFWEAATLDCGLEREEWWTGLIFVYLTASMAGLSLILWRRNRGRPGITSSLTALILLSMLTFMFCFASFVYPHFPSQFGGGEPIRARLLLAKDAPDDIGKLGVPMPPDSRVSYPVDVLHDGESVYVISNSTQTFQVAKSLVVGIRPKPDDFAFTISPTFEFVTWELEEVYEWRRLAIEESGKISAEEQAKVTKETSDLREARIGQQRKKCDELCWLLVSGFRDIYLREKSKLGPAGPLASASAQEEKPTQGGPK